MKQLQFDFVTATGEKQLKMYEIYSCRTTFVKLLTTNKELFFKTWEKLKDKKYITSNLGFEYLDINGGGPAYLYNTYYIWEYELIYYRKTYSWFKE